MGRSGVSYYDVLGVSKDVSQEDLKVNYTQNEWGRCKNTLETSGEDVKLHSKRVGKM
jgi:hypothetical protein